MQKQERYSSVDDGWPGSNMAADELTLSDWLSSDSDDVPRKLLQVRISGIRFFRRNVANKGKLYKGDESHPVALMQDRTIELAGGYTDTGDTTVLTRWETPETVHLDDFPEVFLPEATGICENEIGHADEVLMRAKKRGSSKRVLGFLHKKNG